MPATAPTHASREALAWVRPWMGLCALLLLCAAKGVWFAGDLTVPPDEDILRDLGFIQGLRDGKLWDDPVQAGAWRWYPPLVHALAAGVFRLTGTDLLPAWVRAGAWLNLATPLCFFLLVRRIASGWAALSATAVLVLYGGATMAGDEAAGYTPWTYTPALVWPAFFLTTWLLIARVEDLRWRDAVLLGGAIGLVFLAHTVPALLLAGMTAATVLATHGLRPRALAWLALAGSVALAGSLPFLLPLLRVYRLEIANPVPGAWVHGLLTPEAIDRVLLLNLPGLLALPVLRTLPRPAAAALAAWIGLCLLGLARHYACQAGIGLGLGLGCRVLVIAPHHYHVYLQAAWACLIGIALARWLAREVSGVGRALATAAAAIGAIGMFQYTPDLDRRRAALDAPDRVLDRAAHAWILRHTTPEDLFATPLPDAPDSLGATVGTVFAAGRRLVAPPAVHSNPYLPWPPLDARRRAALAGTPDALCTLHRAAARGASAWLLLPRGHTPPLPPAFETADHVLVRVPPTVCDPGLR